MLGLKQLIKVPTRVTCSSSTIIDHILASFPNRVSQLQNQKRYAQGIRYRSLKNYSADIYEEDLGRVDFPNYYNFENINDAYSNFIQKVMGVIDLVAPIKSR